MKQTSPHIVIIGGGVIGTAIAYYLSKQDARVTLLEAWDLAAGSSGACDGLVFMQSKKPGIHLTLAMESLKHFHTLQRELPVDIEFRQTGGMVVMETDAEYRAMATHVQEQQANGLDVHLLDRDKTLEKEPFLSPGLAGATWSSLDGQVNPINLALGFARGARQNHAQIITQARVTGIQTRNNRVTGVETSAGTFSADLVVNAAGARAAQVSALVDIPVPIQPRRGQIVVTHAARPLLHHCLISAKYIAAKYDPSLADRAGEGISMEQTANGNLLLGSTREFAGFNTRNTVTGIKKIISQTARLVPALKTCQVIRTFAGLRPYTPDGLPLLGPVKALEGFIMAAGHEGDGIALSPITGKLMADMLCQRPLHMGMDLFLPDRFEEKGTPHHE